MRGFYLQCLIMLTLASSVNAKQLPRYSAKLGDGRRITGNELTDWHNTQSAPKLDDQPLMEAAAPLVWLRDHSLAPSDTPSAFVEFFSGDRLPCDIIGFRRGDESMGERLPAHLVVRPRISLRPQQQLPDAELRVLTKFVRRIVWRRVRESQFDQQTAFFRDGRRTDFRAIRFSDGYITLLANDGTQQVPFSDLAEIHMPRVDYWQHYLDELALLCPTGKSRLWQFETTDGLIATSSRNRFAAYTWGSSADPTRWVHGIQPAWSLDILWIPNANIWMRRMFAIDEMPLCRVPPIEARQRLLLAGGDLPWRVNRNTRGEALQSGQASYGWGLGVHAYSELHFPMPPYARSLRGELGLDQCVGTGGCVQGRVFLDDINGSPLYESSPLVGSATTADLGELEFTTIESGRRRLILQVDPMAENTPKGADPFDIRDAADWLDVELVLDRATLLREIQKATVANIAAWDGWDVEGVVQATWHHEQRQIQDRPGSFLSYLSTSEKPLVLSRNLEIRDNDRWLIVSVSQERSREDRPNIEVRINGETVFVQPVPYRDRWRQDVEAMVVPLDPYRPSDDRSLRIEIRQTGTNDVPVGWHSIAITDQLPMLHQVLDDDCRFSPLGDDAPGSAAFVDARHYTGDRSLKLTPQRRFRLELDETIRIRERPVWGEYRFIRFVIRKQDAGRFCLELDHRDARNHPSRYDAGLGPPSFGMARRVWDQKLPDQWIVITRDIFADFGDLDIDSLIVSIPDGTAAFLDHFYFAKHPDDFRLIADQPSVERTNQQARRSIAKPVLDRVLPSCVAIDFGDGRWATGTVVSGDGYILTSGHLVLEAVKPVTIHRANGKTANGTTRGVARDLDLGLVKITDSGSWPSVEIEQGADLPSDSLYVGVSYRRVVQAGDEPSVHAGGVRRVLPNSIWTEFETDDWSSGGPLFNEYGKLIGIHSRPSGFGGFLYMRLRDSQSTLDRMKKGDVWGNWRMGTGPLVGVVIATTADGCKVTSVVPGMSAEKAGIRVGDILTQVLGVNVSTLDEVYQALAATTSDQNVPVRYLRDGQSHQAEIRLSPRVP